VRSKVQSRLFTHRLVPSSFIGLRFKVAQAVRTHSDLEVNEARLDWLHTRANDQHDDLAKAEVEKGFGLLTLELEVPFERDVAADTVSGGVGNISFGARYPVYQVVSGDGFVDSTFGAAVEIGMPVNSSVSKNIETVPKIFNDLRLGDHFTLQSIVGFSTRSLGVSGFALISRPLAQCNLGSGSVSSSRSTEGPARTARWGVITSLVFEY
jgi:hypothetical protein